MLKLQLEFWQSGEEKFAFVCILECGSDGEGFLG